MKTKFQFSISNFLFPFGNRQSAIGNQQLEIVP
jgi:hypothetical protein